MAELLIKIGSVGNPNDERSYNDADIVSCKHDLQIKNLHANVICHVRKDGFTSDGLRTSGTLADYYLSKIFEYRFQRVSRREVQRISLRNVLEPPSIIGATRNADGDAMDVPLFIQLGQQDPNHKIFGVPGAEYWYGGDRRYSHAKLDEVWQQIELLRPERQVNHRLWPWTANEKRLFLALCCDDMTPEEARQLMAPEVAEGVAVKGANEIIKKRKHRAPFRGGRIPLLAPEQDIDDRQKEIDERDPDNRVFLRDVIVEVKP